MVARNLHTLSLPGFKTLKLQVFFVPVVLQEISQREQPVVH
jgi:hypothetical protein